MGGLAHSIAKTFHMLFPCTQSQSRGAGQSRSTSSDFVKISAKLKDKAGELGKCLNDIDKALSSAAPRDEKARNLKKEFSDTAKSVRSLVQKAIARIDDLRKFAVWLSDPLEQEDKVKEIRLLADDLKEKSKNARETLENLENVIDKLDRFWSTNSLGDEAPPRNRLLEQQACKALCDLKQALQNNPLDNTLAGVLKTTSFPGTMSSTVRLLPRNDSVTLHEMIDGKKSGATIEHVNGEDFVQISIPPNQLNSLMNVWRIILTDLGAVGERCILDDNSQVMDYQDKLRVVMEVYALYGLSLGVFAVAIR